MPTHCTIGALGDFLLPRGIYVYVGSAWGPGGLRARVGRHLRGSPNPRWHIDYLRSIASPVAVWLARDAHLECAWAQALLEHPVLDIIVPRFGASDCRCATHLVFAPKVDLASLVLPGGTSS